ncbi:hypothetical protein [Thermomonas sp.]|uniref:hypothetical protein n=1 Tax=Thermomonas sp. TaxID=1971895 RepID=UPI00248A148C|nr:hypothetical protein [Thermomonas sp.]MDI1252178.1 hypothetical protein [Thermomonas sp.]
MTTPPAPVSSPPAIAAFVRGVGQRARLLATVQAGASKPAEQALAVVARVFASEAGQWPIAQWPQQYWRLLLATPHLRQPGTPEPGLPLPGIARLAPTQRAAFLLQLVAGLDDATAATALGTSVSAYQDVIRDGLPCDALGQPDIDVWRAWREAVQRELANARPAPDVLVPESRTAPPPKAASAPAGEVIANEAHHRHVRWLWLGVAICVLAFATTFFLHPAGRAVLQRWTATIKLEPLPAAAAPKARFDADDGGSHPDRELLAAPEETGHASQLALLSWLTVNSEDPRAADAVQLPVITAPKPRTNMDPAHDASAMATRLHQWDVLPARVHGLRRGQWQAWRALTAGERIQLRGIAERWRTLAPQQQQALRERFQVQTFDARNGWWLGPTLGRDWPRIQALFAYVDVGQRDALLQLLRTTDRDGWDVLARLAQTTSPEERAQLRAELLAQAPSQRGAWLRAQLAR